MIIKVTLTIIFLAVMIGVGVYSRKQASTVDGFVLGGRAVGPWLTAFAFGTSYFSAVVFFCQANKVFFLKCALCGLFICIKHHSLTYVTKIT